MKRDIDPIVLEKRLERERLERAYLKRVKKLKRWQDERLKERNWPLDTSTGKRADIDPDDVDAPPEEELPQITAEQLAEAAAAASEPPSLYMEIDAGVLARRRADRQKELDDRAAVLGPKWTPEIVEARIEEAFRVLGKLSVGGSGPREFGNGMPTPLRSMTDLVNQAGNKSLRNAMKRMLRDDGPPSSDQVTRMNDAICWAVQYLRDEDPDLALFLNLGGLWKAGGRKVTKECEKIGVQRQQFYRDRKAAVMKIVDGLTRDRKVPT